MQNTVQPTLPDELVLEICKHVDQEELWVSFRNVNSQYRRCAEDVVKSHVREHMTIQLNFAIGIGLKHRWYDIRASINLECCEVSNEYAFFSAPVFLPESCRDRAAEKWKEILAAGIDCAQAWKISLESSDLRYACLPNLTLSQHGAYIDWRELLDAFFRKTVPPEQYWAKQWQAV
ncbi:uncharacterized protein RCC_03795 [Ramularia collo-cygni]|uniref:F-box domain-containing protein n=1 Tax=Ramularia collo-cygni TaxID=112498 RepID=A0A2D3V343_9PEZI|nr:uncharacterized protein RCC_03795 [Ramularia collo-cygni]CZT17956.1 uncharacterized protein RCC_03795 [Ramularia collo-cygni]